MAHSLSAYLTVIEGLLQRGWSLQPVRDYFCRPAVPPFVYLRHDVDRLPSRAVVMAEAEAGRGVRATYYFRCDGVGRFPVDAMERILSVGHEIGFHYESLSRCQGDVSAAMALFDRELALCRKIAPVDTIAPHGAPLSRFSNMEFSVGVLGERFGLLGDASEMDFRRMLYVTDTGGTFGSRYNLRDKVNGRMLLEKTDPKSLAQRLIDEGEERIVLSCHPERWPIGRFGLLQAVATDLTVNAAKVLLGNR